MEGINQHDKGASLHDSYRGLLHCHAKFTGFPLIGGQRDREAERHMMDASLAASLERVITRNQMLASPSLLQRRSWEADETLTSEQ